MSAPGSVSEAGLPVDHGLQQFQRLDVLRLTAFQRVLERAELLQRRVLVAGIDHQQQLPHQRLDTDVVVDLGARIAVGVVVVRIEIVVGQGHGSSIRGKPGWGQGRTRCAR